MLTAVMKTPAKLYSAAYLRYIKERLPKAHMPHLAELAAFYDDDDLRAVVSERLEIERYLEVHAACLQQAAVGLIERMLVAEVIVRPDSRQVDIAKDMLIDSSSLGHWSYHLGKAKIFDRRTVGGRVFLAPGKRCEDVGLDAASAASLIASRTSSPEHWEPVVYLATYSHWIAELCEKPDLDDGYLYSSDGLDSCEVELEEL